MKLLFSPAVRALRVLLLTTLAVVASLILLYMCMMKQRKVSSHRNTYTIKNYLYNFIFHVTCLNVVAKKDFTCPRDLIVEEMRYFADYLSTDVHVYDDVDISVHCDIGIFDWLMQYAKRGLLEDTTGNVISEPLKKPSLSKSGECSIRMF